MVSLDKANRNYYGRGLIFQKFPLTQIRFQVRTVTTARIFLKLHTCLIFYDENPTQVDAYT